MLIAFLLLSFNAPASTIEIDISPKSHFLLFNNFKTENPQVSGILKTGKIKQKIKLSLRGDLPKHKDINYPSFQIEQFDKKIKYDFHTDFLRADDKYYFIEQITNFFPDHFSSYLPKMELKKVKFNKKSQFYLTRQSIDKNYLSKNLDKESSYFKFRHFFKKKIHGLYTSYTPLASSRTLTTTSYLNHTWYRNIGKGDNEIIFSEFLNNIIKSPAKSKLDLNNYSMFVALMLFLNSDHSLEADNLIWYYSYKNDQFKVLPKDLHIHEYSITLEARLKKLQEKDIILKNLITKTNFRTLLNKNLSLIKDKIFLIKTHIDLLEKKFPDLINAPDYQIVKERFSVNIKEFIDDHIIK